LLYSARASSDHPVRLLLDTLLIEGVQLVVDARAISNSEAERMRRLCEDAALYYLRSPLHVAAYETDDEHMQHVGNLALRHRTCVVTDADADGTLPVRVADLKALHHIRLDVGNPSMRAGV
jgi:hypothetical protein